MLIACVTATQTALAINYYVTHGKLHLHYCYGDYTLLLMYSILALRTIVHHTQAYYIEFLVFVEKPKIHTSMIIIKKRVHA